MTLAPRAFKGFAGLVLACALIAGNALAEEANRGSSVWINPGIYSQHFDRSKNLRNDNVGLGGEVLLNQDHAFLAGSYINSNRARTRYGAYEWRPLHGQLAGLDLSGGIAVGAFDGYPRYHEGGWFVAALPVLSIEGKRFGANLSVIPTIADRLDGALAIQVKLKVW